MPQFHSSGRFSECSVQVGTGTQNPNFALEPYHRQHSSHWPCQRQAAVISKAPHRPTTWTIRTPAYMGPEPGTELTCPGKPILNYLANIWPPAGKLRTMVCTFLVQNPGRNTPWPIFILLKWGLSGYKEDSGIRSLISLVSCLTHQVHSHIDIECGKLGN